MSSTIAVDELRVGMFIHLEGGWLSHPFPLSSFKLSSADQIATLRGLGLVRVRWVPEKSDLEPAAPEQSANVAVSDAPAVRVVERKDPAEQRRRLLTAQREAVLMCERQHAEAARAWRQASDAVASQPGVACRATEALTRAMLSKMLVQQEIGIRLVACGGDSAAAHALRG